MTTKGLSLFLSSNYKSYDFADQIFFQNKYLNINSSKIVDTAVVFASRF